MKLTQSARMTARGYYIPGRLSTGKRPAHEKKLLLYLKALVSHYGI